jgi:hypothetical protein
MVPIKDMAEHLKHLHSATLCHKCGDSFEVWQESFHECRSQLSRCETCGLHLMPEQLPDHVSLCLMRTEQCPVCMKFVKISELSLHLMQNCMPGLNEAVQVNVKKGKGRKNKKKDWVKVQFVRKSEENLEQFKDVRNLEDRDRLVAENLLEEIIFSDLAKEDQEFFR